MHHINLCASTNWEESVFNAPYLVFDSLGWYSGILLHTSGHSSLLLTYILQNTKEDGNSSCYFILSSFNMIGGCGVHIW